MLKGFTLNDNNLLECDGCGTTFNDEAEAEKHLNIIRCVVCDDPINSFNVPPKNVKPVCYWCAQKEERL